MNVALQCELTLQNTARKKSQNVKYSQKHSQRQNIPRKAAE